MKITTTLYRAAWLVVLLSVSFSARSQDARYANLTATPQLTNPALTGVSPSMLRFTANYRELYTSLLGTDGYRSYAAGVEVRRPAGSGNYFGFGAQVQRDEAGTSDFQRTQGLLGLSYQQQISGSSRRGIGQYLAGGAQVGFGQRGYDLNKLWFSNQYFIDPNSRESYVDQTLPTGERFTGSGSGTYLDVNAGLAWFGNFGDRLGAYFGLAAYHLNAPNVSPIPDLTDDLDQRYVVHGGGELPLGAGYTSLLPAARVMLQGPALDALLGANLRYTQREWREIALRTGLWLQGSNQASDRINLNALILSVGLETERIQFAVNYDVSMGNLRSVSDGRAGWELSVIYQAGEVSARNRVVCPKF